MYPILSLTLSRIYTGMCSKKYRDGEQTQNLSVLQYFKELELFNLKKAQRGSMKNTANRPTQYHFQSSPTTLSSTKSFAITKLHFPDSLASKRLHGI